MLGVNPLPLPQFIDNHKSESDPRYDDDHDACYPEQQPIFKFHKHKSDNKRYDTTGWIIRTVRNPPY